MLCIQEALLTASGYYEGTGLVASSGKLQVLEKMLRKLRVCVCVTVCVCVVCVCCAHVHALCESLGSCDCHVSPGAGTQSADILTDDQDAGYTGGLP